MSEKASNFIRNIIIDDLETGKHKAAITRFPPEPNGLLHIGHAKAITVNFDLANEFGGHTYLRFDDTNPTKEEVEYVELIKRDIEWLGFKWVDLRFASDYFDEMYKRALLLIEKGKAYVDDLSADEIREHRGTLTEPGKNSPYRERSIEENMDLFVRMKNGEFADGSRVLRAKIDMSAPNIHMRDPVIYRILHESHFHVGDKWCIYPMYDYAHPIEDAIEGITHSLCSIEFEDNRPLYDWVVKECEMESVPRQIEFSKLYITNSILGKRYILKMVKDNIIDGWDDPRLLTISGMRRRGYTPEGIKSFVRAVGVSKAYSLVDYKMLEHFIREDLKLSVPRTMAVINPLKVVITNYEEGKIEYLEAENNVENEELGTRQIAFSREIYIEKDDFMEVAPNKKYKRLSVGAEVRLKHAYFIKCTDVIKDENGEIVEIRATYDPATKSGSGFNERKPNGTIHWVDATTAVPAEFRNYDLLVNENFDRNRPIDEQINTDSLHIYHGFVEENLKDVSHFDRFQFFRHGYYSVDPKYSVDGKIVFNEVVSLKSSYK